MEADGLDAWLPQKQPNFRPLVALLEKIKSPHTVYNSKKLKDREAETRSH